MTTEYNLEHYLRQLRKIEEHREARCEENVKRIYEELLTDLQGFLGKTYAELAVDDKLTYEILFRNAKYARFLEEVEKRINTFTPEAAREIRETVENTYKASYNGMEEAVKQSKNHNELKNSLSGLRAVTPDVLKRAIENPVSGLTLNDTLEKNRQTVIYDIKQQIGIGLSQGDRMSTMAKRISDKIGMDYNKAIRIVRTETHRVREAGYQDASERISENLDDDWVMTKTWKTMEDEAVRPQRPAYKRKKGVKPRKAITAGLRSSLSGPNHVKMHDVIVLVDELFDLGGGVYTKAPGQSGEAGHDINCRCYTVRDLMTKEEFSKLTGRTFEKTESQKIAQQERKLLEEQKQLEQDKIDAENSIKRLEQETYDIDYVGFDVKAYADNPQYFDGLYDTYQHRYDITNKDEVDKLLASVIPGPDPETINAAKTLGTYFETELGLKKARDYGLDAKYLLKYESKDIDTLKDHVSRYAKRLHDELEPDLDSIANLVMDGQRYITLKDSLPQIKKDLASIANEVKLLNKNGFYYSSISKEPTITKDLKKIIANTNSELVGLDYRLKGFDSYSRKVKKEVVDLQQFFDDVGIKRTATVEDAILNMHDVVRYTDISDVKDFVKNYQDITSALEDAGYSIVRVRNTFKPSSTYKGINTIVRTPDGYEFELQFHTKQSFDLKNGILHELYEKERLVDTSLAEKQLLRKQMQEISESIVLPDGVDTIKSFDKLDDFIDLKIKTSFEGVQKRRSEIEELTKQIKDTKKAKDTSLLRTIKLECEDIDAAEYLTDAGTRDWIDMYWKSLQQDKAAGTLNPKRQSKYNEYEKFFKDLAATQKSQVDVDDIKALIKTKKDELTVLERDLNLFVNAKANTMRKELIAEVDNQIDDLKAVMRSSTNHWGETTIEDFVENERNRQRLEKLHTDYRQEITRLKKEDEFAKQCITIGDRPQGISAAQYLDDKATKRFVDDEWKHLKKVHNNGTIKDWEVERYDNYKKFFDDIDNYNKNDDVVKELKRVRQEKNRLEDFMTEAEDYADKLEKLEKEKKKVAAKVDAFKAKYTGSDAPRTESAKILDDLQDYADKHTDTFDRQWSKLARDMGVSKDEARELVSEELSQIINNCDVGIRIKDYNLEKVLDSGEFKNLFETGTGGGCTSQAIRAAGEQDVFGIMKGSISNADRPIYGQMIPNLDTGRSDQAVWYITNGPGMGYGNGVTVVIKKNKVRHNASFTLGDSLNEAGDLFGSTFDNPVYNGGFWDFDGAARDVLLDSSLTSNEKLMHSFTYNYLEVQIHGKENHTADIIEKVYFTRNAARNKTLLDKLDSLGIPYEILD